MHGRGVPRSSATDTDLGGPAASRVRPSPDRVSVGVPTTSEPHGPFPRRRDDDGHRELAVKAWLSGLSVLGLLAVAGMAASGGHVLFTIALVVLAVFAAVELTSTLRGRR